MAVDDTLVLNRVFYPVLKKATTLRVFLIVNKAGLTLKPRSYSLLNKTGYSKLKKWNLVKYDSPSLRKKFVTVKWCDFYTQAITDLRKEQGGWDFVESSQNKKSIDKYISTFLVKSYFLWFNLFQN